MRHAAEKILNEYSENLARSNRELEDFAYVASHDLQEPLRKIQAFGNLLESEYSDKIRGEGSEYLKRMQNAASRMSTLIEDLLAFSRVTTRQNPLEHISLNLIVGDVLGDLETRIQETNATIDVGALGKVVADPTHMRQLFQNLIGNALKFHKPDTAPAIKISGVTKSGDIEIKVSDNGIGFEEKYMDRIFSVFQRLHDKKSYEGTGIGLAVCRKIAERYNGTITATSKKGMGSTFIVRFPREPKGELK
jgi:light-regulated signal transduction histidine kinase (bacteriophytochrome)